MMDDNVIPLIQPKSDEKELLNVKVTDRKDFTKQHCKHRAIEICETDRSVRCVTCGCAVDPFDHILRCATDAEHIVTEIELLHRRRGELREAVANLEREEKNAKARLRSARTSILYAENDLKTVEGR
ncbi:hypothetical protein [Atlantibacter hermannii]|uniref:hypothetical protein n=1 Tax=Atlantibacter hermannii TaxID=565 RepID=UPI0035D43BE4